VESLEIGSTDLSLHQAQPLNDDLKELRPQILPGPQIACVSVRSTRKTRSPSDEQAAFIAPFGDCSWITGNPEIMLQIGPDKRATG
jgi:hypothetical protein